MNEQEPCENMLIEMNLVFFADDVPISVKKRIQETIRTRSGLAIMVMDIMERFALHQVNQVREIETFEEVVDE